MKTREFGIFESGRLNTFDKFYVVSLFFYCFLLFSPTVYAIVPFSSALAFAVRIFIAAALTIYTAEQAVRRGSVKINKGLLCISFAFVLLSLIPTAYHKTAYLLVNEFVSFYLVYMFFLFYKKKYLQPLVSLATPFMFLMLALSITGFAYAFLGFPPIASGTVSAGSATRMYYWYLTTGAVDNGIFGSIIRPQAIFDEPGGFSFFICTLCFLRVLAKRRESATFILLLLGNITFSMIHAMIFVLYICHLAVTYTAKKRFAVYAAAVVTMMFLAYLPLKKQVDELLFARFVINQSTGHFDGNNRAYLLENAVNAVKQDNSVLIWGMQRDADGLTVMDKMWGYGENPLAPALKFGIFIAWLYYFYLAFFAMCAAADRKRAFIYLAVILMFMQRPEFYRGGPAANVLVLFFTSWEIVKYRIAKYRMTARGSPPQVSPEPRGL
ncbi:MAG: hypothetical protein FWB85_00520 [Chitinispirillia bacterium]|nr:hypothetical protein [Chitinispirillia bacterium]MCL2240990.1 hypothetical protein [Chitinispirillia bacterium]